MRLYVISAMQERGLHGLFIRGFGLLLLAAAGLSVFVPVVAEAENSAEQERVTNKIKVAYLYNFMRLVDWPESSHESKVSPIVTCILGDDPFGTLFDPIKLKKSHERSLEIVNLDKAEDIGNRCHLLYVSVSEKDNLAPVFENVAGSAILTVSDVEGFIGQGGMVSFVMDGDKVKFKIDLARTEKAGLKVNERLVKIAVPL
jgi:hypothetical protein